MYISTFNFSHHLQTSLTINFSHLLLDVWLASHTDELPNTTVDFFLLPQIDDPPISYLNKRHRYSHSYLNQIPVLF